MLQFLEQCNLVLSPQAHPNTGQGCFIFLSITTLTSTPGSTNHNSRQHAQVTTADCQAGKTHVFSYFRSCWKVELSTEGKKGKNKNTCHAHKCVYFWLSAYFHTRAFSVLRENNFFHEWIYDCQLPESKLKSVIHGRHLKLSMFLSLHSFR